MQPKLHENPPTSGGDQHTIQMKRNSKIQPELKIFFLNKLWRSPMNYIPLYLKLVIIQILIAKGSLHVYVTVRKRATVLKRCTVDRGEPLIA